MEIKYIVIFSGVIIFTIFLVWLSIKSQKEALTREPPKEFRRRPLREQLRLSQQLTRGY